MLLPALHHFLGSTAKGGSLARAVRNVFFGDAVEGMEVVLGGGEEKAFRLLFFGLDDFLVEA